MDFDKIEKSDVEFFFNKYKHNIDQIFYLERKLINESYNYEKWEKFLSENSTLTREYFIENQRLLEKYLHPVIESPEKLEKSVLETYLRHILFFLFENNIDFHLAEDLPSAILKNPEKYDDLILFEANMCLAVSHTVSTNSDEQTTYSYFKKCFEIYPNFESCPDDNTRIHLVFCFSYVFLMFILYRSINYKEFLKIYDRFERVVKNGSRPLYEKMWGKTSDYDFHIELLLRHFKVYAIMMAGLSNFVVNLKASDYEEQQNCVNVIKNWLYKEYELEQEEDYINPMIFTYYNRDLFQEEKISAREYNNRLTEEFNIIKANPYVYSEINFPQDDDPVDPQFARTLDKMKIFSKAFTSTYVFLPELLDLTKDLTLKKMIIELIVRYFENSKYSAKGFCTAKFLTKLVSQVGKYFDSVEEFCSFVQIIFIHKQISTANHIELLSHIVTLCVTTLIDKSPEFFIIPGVINTEEDVIAEKSRIQNFLKHASLLHDLGKLSCSNLVNLHFRRITETEFAAIKLHPKKGVEIIKDLEYLSAFTDLILGHHKNWDDSDGYPQDFYIQDSKYKNYISLLSICDAIDTATDSKGRNYINAQTFEQISLELENDFNVRYNAKLVKAIFSDKDLVEELKRVTSTGRNFISYKTYQKFILPNKNFSEEDEKSIILYSKKYKSEVETFYKKCYPQKENFIPSHIQEIIDLPNSLTFMLIDKKNNIFGLLSGSVLTSIENEDKYFQINDFIVLPEERRKGHGSLILETTFDNLKEKGILNIKINVSSEFSSSSFFWIEGFVPSKQTMMEKHLL